MKILVAFYSKTGHTKKVALDIAKKLNADVDEIVDLKDRSGILGWIFAGRDEIKGYMTEIKTTKDPQEYDLVVVGSPVWAAYSTPAARTYINNFKNKFKNVAFFVTSGGDSAEKPVGYLETVLEKKVVAHEGWTEKQLKSPSTYLEKLDKFVLELKKIN